MNEGSRPPAHHPLPEGATLSTAEAGTGRNLAVISSAPGCILAEFSAGTLGGKLIDATESPGTSLSRG